MPDYSYWIIFGLILVIAEFALSGLVTIFLGLAALLVGALVYLGLLDSLVWEITLFATFSLVLLAVARRYLRDRLFGRETRGATSEDSAGLVGARAIVDGAFTDGIGAVRFRGARWQAQSDHPLRDGQMVRIIRHDGLWLTVAPWSDTDAVGGGDNTTL